MLWTRKLNLALVVAGSTLVGSYMLACSGDDTKGTVTPTDGGKSDVTVTGDGGGGGTDGGGGGTDGGGGGGDGGGEMDTGTPEAPKKTGFVSGFQLEAAGMTFGTPSAGFSDATNVAAGTPPTSTTMMSGKCTMVQTDIPEATDAEAPDAGVPVVVSAGKIDITGGVNDATLNFADRKSVV